MKRNNQPVEIIFNSDESCEMEQLIINGEVVCEGNVWDYHVADRVDALKSALKQLDIPFTYTTNPNWTYDE